MHSNNRHLIFSDESGWESSNRFGSLAKISGNHENTKELNSVLKEILEKNNKKEIKFKDVDGHDTKQIAIDFLNKSFEFLHASKIKVHVLVWDKHDSRHNVPNRCDIENMKRMYYHNMKVLLKHWNVETKWEFYPDEFTPINWKNDVIKYIENTNLLKNESQLELFQVFKGMSFPTFQNTKELLSGSYPIIQLADIYAGLIRTSRKESDNFNLYYLSKKDENQLSLFDDRQTLNISKSLRTKFDVMVHFKEKADSLRMGVSFSENKYFKTFNCKGNINIWHYEPQGPFDKAPTRIKKEGVN
jgi:hypothetical protein